MSVHSVIISSTFVMKSNEWAGGQAKLTKYHFSHIYLPWQGIIKDYDHPFLSRGYAVARKDIQFKCPGRAAIKISLSFIFCVSIFTFVWQKFCLSQP